MQEEANNIWCCEEKCMAWQPEMQGTTYHIEKGYCKLIGEIKEGV